MAQCVPTSRVSEDKYGMMRPICQECKQRPRAVAYHKEDSIQYRSQCEACVKKKRRVKAAVPRWQTAGYKKKATCDRCGFKSKYAAQSLVYHVDGNLHNTNITNLKTVCLNCTIEIKKSDLPWTPGDLTPDN